MVPAILTINALLLLTFMTCCFLVARLRQRLDTVDIAWGLGFILVAWMTVAASPTGRSWLVAVLVNTWGLRLSWHIWRRNRGRADDRRYLELSAKWRGNFWLRAYVSIFLLQGGLVLLISLPLAMLSNPELSGRSWLSIAGTFIWFVGFTVEVIADRQLAQFTRSEGHPKVLQTGLWRYSRHPNYFGELTQWWGIGLIGLQVRDGWLGLLGPLVLSWLIIFVSGLPPIEKRHQKDAAYRTYQARTSPLIPWPPRA